MGDSRRMMVMPAETLIPVKRQSGKNQTITMRDVAKSSGFSLAKVSIVLNNARLARYIAPATKSASRNWRRSLATGRQRRPGKA